MRYKTTDEEKVDFLTQDGMQVKPEQNIPCKYFSPGWKLTCPLLTFLYIWNNKTNAVCVTYLLLTFPYIWNNNTNACLCNIPSLRKQPTRAALKKKRFFQSSLKMISSRSSEDFRESLLRLNNVQQIKRNRLENKL